MVTHWFRATAIALLLTACSADQSSETIEDGAAGGSATAGPSSAVVTVADTTRATDAPPTELVGHTLQLRLREGARTRYKIAQYAEDRQDTITALSEATHVFDQTVRSVRGDGAYEIGITYTSITSSGSLKNLKTGQMIRSEKYNSKDTADLRNPRNAQFSALLGETVTLILTPKAEVQEISGVSTIVNKMVAKLPKQEGQQQLPQEAKLEIQKQVETIMYRSILGQELIPFPTGPIDSTLTWDHSQTAPVNPLYTINTKATYRIVKVRKVKGRRIATVNATIAGTVVTNAPPAQAGISVKMNSSNISGEGVAIVDIDNGMTISKKSKVSISLSATINEKATGKVVKVNNTSIKRFDIELLP